MPSHSRRLGIDHIPLFDHITYIGNTAKGVSVMQDAHDASASTSMFMSVLNPSVVCADADLATAVRSVAYQSFMNAGQSLVHIEKVYVAAEVYDQFMLRLKSLVERRIVVGARYDHRATMGSLYSQDRLDRLVAHIDDALVCGADLVTGGKARPDIGPWFHEPTILANVPHHALAWDEETYGPLLIVERFTDLDEVLDELRQTQYCSGLQLITSDFAKARRISKSVPAGLVAINDGYHSVWGAWNAPVQGWRDSGTGVRHGWPAVRQYTRSMITSRSYGYTGEPHENMSLENWEKLSWRILRFCDHFHTY